MTFSIRILRRILCRQTGLAPWQVKIFSEFRGDLCLTDVQINAVLAEIHVLTGLAFPTDTAEHLTDVFDLLIHVLLRLPETGETEHYYGPLPPQLADRLPTTNYAPTLVALSAAQIN